MRGPAARIVGIALAAAVSAAAPACAAPASSGYEDGLAAYQRNDYAKSLQLLRPLAERGDARAQYLVGRQYQFGQAVKPDRAEAFYWYKRAEAKGHQEAKLFRLLLEKRWKITAAEKRRAEHKLAADRAPKPKPQVARIESRPTPRPERLTAETSKRRVATKIALHAPERARPAPAKPPVETARARVPEPPSTRPEPARAKAPDSPATVAARSPLPGETTSAPPAVRRGASEIARAAPRSPSRSDAEKDDEGAVPRRYEAPPPETRTAVAAVPNTPPPADDHAGDYAPYDVPNAPAYVPPPSYPPPASYSPPAPYYAPGPAPYYAPAAPPSWRGSIYFGPRPHFRGPWGYRPHGRYVHPGWRARARW